ncbi:hypothetical protein CPC08DRAFT_783685 [Agrocybe pediades]|nr:hypothetical protein CPC08DRAFT_783685 [Agrocybe pediades]
MGVPPSFLLCLTFSSPLICNLLHMGAGTIVVTAQDLPSFLYEEGFKYDPKVPEYGLFRSHTMIRALRLLYTGSSSILTGHRNASRDGQAELHGMRSVTVHAVAYTATQVYINLTSLERLAVQFDHFNLEKFHTPNPAKNKPIILSGVNTIIGILTKDSKHPWVVETLQFLTGLPLLNRKKKGKKGKASLNDPCEEDNIDPTGILALWKKRDLKAAQEPSPFFDDDNNSQVGTPTTHPQPVDPPQPVTAARPLPIAQEPPRNSSPAPQIPSPPEECFPEPQILQTQDERCEPSTLPDNVLAPAVHNLRKCQRSSGRGGQAKCGRKN